MVRYIFVAGVFAAAVLAAPAQDAAEVGAAPAGWGDNSPSLGEALFGWGKSKPSKPAAVAVEEASPSTWYTPPSSSSSGIWGSLFGGNRGDRENKGGSGAGSSASTPSSSDWGSRFGGNKGGSGADISAPPKSSPGGGFFSGIFGASRPKPASSGPPSGSSWGRPKPDSTKPKPESSESSEQNASPWSWLRPKPDSSKPKPEEWPATPEPKPASSESSDEAESSASTPASKPEPAQPKPETAVPVPVPAPLEPKPEPVQPKPETAAPAPVPTPVQPKPKPAEPKPETEAIPKPTTSSSDSICGPNSLEPASDDIETIRKRLWQPKIGSKWQIILDGVPDTKRAVLKPEDATIFDIDLWDAHADHICDLKKRGKKVICYFSAGTSEEWRKAPEYPDGDFKELKAYNKGQICADLESNGKGCKKYWGGEQWVDITSNKVWQIMAKRIKMAADKGCDALDPDNMDGFDNFVKNQKFSPGDSIKYLKFLADEAAKYGMSVGLKNSLSIIPQVKSYVQFAVNEECARVKECQEYKELLGLKKPVLHIEYTSTSGSNAATTKATYKDPSGATKKYCNPLREAVSRFSTIIKAGETLSNQYLYCDGKPADFTAMASWTDKKGGKGKGNFVNSESSPDEDSSGFESNERFTNSTIVADEQNTNSTIVARDLIIEGPWKVKRRHHRRAVKIPAF